MLWWGRGGVGWGGDWMEAERGRGGEGEKGGVGEGRDGVGTLGGGGGLVREGREREERGRMTASTSGYVTR